MTFSCLVPRPLFLVLIVVFFFSHKGAFATLCEEVAFSDPESFASAMTKGLTLREGQGLLMALYLKNKTPYPPEGMIQTLLEDVLRILDSYPEFAKPLLREQVLEFPLIERESPESLKNFVRSFTRSAGRIRNNLFKIEANLGFWMTMLGFSKNTEKNSFITWLNTTPLDQKTRDFIKDPAKPYKERAVALYRALEEMRKAETADSRGDNNQVVQRIGQAMANLVYTVGFGNEILKAELKSPDPAQSYSALREILNEQDRLAFDLGFEGHFKELKESLGANIHEESKVLTQIAEDIQIQPRTIKGKEVLRLRVLSEQESPFRGCFGGDCSSQSYFEKALDPNFLYFTLTDSQHKSFGQMTLVLGEAENTKGQKVKTAFLDKIQGVSPERLKPMLEGIRLTLKEKGYVLAIPKDIGDFTNGIANESLIRYYVQSNILPLMTESLKGFKPHKHKHNSLFYQGASRADDKLDLWKFEKIQEESYVKIQLGEIHSPKLLMTDVSVRSLYTPVLSLKNSRREEEQTRFLDNLVTLSQIKELGLSENEVREHLKFVLKDTHFSFQVRKKAFFTLIQFEMHKSEVPVFWPVFPQKTDYFLAHFSDKEIVALIGEMSNWKNTFGYKHTFIKHLNYNIENQETFLAVINNLDTLWGKIWDRNILLFDAVQKRDKNAVNKLLDKEADLNAKNEFDDTPLIVAVSNQYKQIVQILLERGADPNITNDYGYTALIVAVEKGNHEMVQILLEKGADPNITNDYGYTALIVAVEKGNHEMVQMLLEKGADPNNTNGKNPLTFAIKRGYKQIVQTLLKKGANPNT